MLASWEFFSSPPRPDRLWGPGSLLSNGYHGLFPLGVERPGREADHSPPSSADVKECVWSYTSTPPVRLHGVVLNLKKSAGTWTQNFRLVLYINIYTHLYVYILHNNGYILQTCDPKLVSCIYFAFARRIFIVESLYITFYYYGGHKVKIAFDSNLHVNYWDQNYEALNHRAEMETEIFIFVFNVIESAHFI
jgi:hypothetical protein